MRATFSYTHLKDNSRDFLRCRLKPEIDVLSSFFDGTNDFIINGKSLIDDGIKKFKIGIDSQASAELEFGAYYLYIMATVDEIENHRGQVIEVANDQSTLKLKEELYKESIRYAPITNAIYAKKLAIFCHLFSLEELNAAKTDNNVLLRLNRALDELFNCHNRLLTAKLGDAAKDIVAGLKIRFLGNTYFVRSKNIRFNIGGDEYTSLLTDLKIKLETVPLLKYDGGSFEENVNHLKWLLNNPYQLHSGNVPIPANTVSEIFRLVGEGTINIITPAQRIFCDRLPLNPLKPQINDPGEEARKLREVSSPTANIKQLTPFMEWKNSGSKEPFPLAKLTHDDIYQEMQIPGGQKELLFRYCNLLENGKLPHGEYSPQKARLILHNHDKRNIEPLNNFLVGSDITPMFLFSPEHSILKRLYSTYKEITSQGIFNFAKLKKFLANTGHLKEIGKYLECLEKDKDFFELAALDPDFHEAISLERFLYSLFDYLTKPQEQVSLDNELDSGTNGKLPDEYIYKPFEVKKTITIASPQSHNGLDIVALNCPLLAEIGVSYGPAEGLPSYHQLAIKYTAIGDPVKRERLHNDFHNYNMKKIIPVEITYSDGTKRSLTIHTAECKRILEELHEQGFSHLKPELTHSI